MPPARSAGSIGKPLTPKGERGKARVLQAATAVLARDGFGGATLGRIADEAAVDKRNVIYYYGTREALLVQVVQMVGGRVAAGIDSAIGETTDPRKLIDASVDAIWAGVTSEPELARAYFALIGGGAGAPEVEDALRDLKLTYLQVIERQLLAIEAAGWKRSGDAESLVLLILAMLRGLLLEWSETGDGSVLQASLGRFKEMLLGTFSAPR